MSASLVARGAAARWAPGPISRVTDRSSTRDVLAGGAIALALIAAIAVEVDVLVAVVAAIACVSAIVAPRVGIAVLIATVSLQEPEVFRPLSFPILLVGSLLAGVTLRVAVDRTAGALNLMVLLGVGYLALAAVTLLPQASGLGYEPTVDGIYQLLQTTAILASVALGQVILRGRDIRPYLWLGLTSVTVVCVLAVFLSFYPSYDAAPFRDLFGRGEETRRMVGPFNDPNYLGLFLAVAATLAIAVARGSRGLPRLIALGIAAFACAVIVLTFSRGALAAAGAGVVLSAFLVDRRLGVVALVGIPLVAVLAAPVFLSTRFSLTTGGLFAQPFRDQAESDSFRSEAFGAGLRMLSDSPVFGTGFGQFQVHARRYIGDNPTTYPHNAAIKLLAEQGIVGTAVFGAMLLAMLARLWRATRHDPRLVLWPALVAYGVGAMFLEPLVTVQASGLLALVVGAVLSREPLASLRQRVAAIGMLSQYRATAGV